jgi:Rieske Fe-S protein
MMSNENRINRRDFLGIATWSIGGLISAIMGVPAIAYLFGPALKRAGEQDWIRLGSTSKVELGVPTLFKAKIERKTGWIVSQEEIAAFVFTENGRDFVAMSNICTHLGCRVRWIADRQQFLSPCHNGVFDKLGGVVSGPPPRPLDRYQVKIENDQLFILGG